MTRKRQLSQEQWEEVAKRILAGDSLRDVARDFKVGESTIRSHFERKTPEPNPSEVRAVDAVLTPALEREEPADRQLSALLRDIALQYARVANISLSSGLRYAMLENTEAQKIDDAQPMETEKSMRAAAILGRLKNDALEPARSLLMASANKDRLQRAMDEAGKTPAGTELTPERQKDAMRRFAFLLARMATEEET